MVPDHWAPIALLARQQRWTTAQTVRVAAIAGTGHTVSTLIIAVIVWIAGVGLALRFGNLVDTLSSVALITFGGWIALASLREIRQHGQMPVHDHARAASSRTALLLILGSSPMVEGIPAFFAASRYGIVQLGLMAVVFAACTIATYVILSLVSVRGMQHVHLGPLERYGEVLSGTFIALLGFAFLLFPRP